MANDFTFDTYEITVKAPVAWTDEYGDTVSTREGWFGLDDRIKAFVDAELKKIDPELSCEVDN